MQDNISPTQINFIAKKYQELGNRYILTDDYEYSQSKKGYLVMTSKFDPSDQLVITYTGRVIASPFKPLAKKKDQGYTYDFFIRLELEKAKLLPSEADDIVQSVELSYIEDGCINVKFLPIQSAPILIQPILLTKAQFGTDIQSIIRKVQDRIIYSPSEEGRKVFLNELSNQYMKILTSYGLNKEDRSILSRRVLKEMLSYEDILALHSILYLFSMNQPKIRFKNCSVDRLAGTIGSYLPFQYTIETKEFSFHNLNEAVDRFLDVKQKLECYIDRRTYFLNLAPFAGWFVSYQPNNDAIQFTWHKYSFLLPLDKPYKKESKEFIKVIEKEYKTEEKQKIELALKGGLYRRSILGYAVLFIIEVSENIRTIDEVIKILRDGIEYDDIRTIYDGKFSVYSQVRIEDVIKQFLLTGLLKCKNPKAAFSDRVLSITSQGRLILRNLEFYKFKKMAEYTEFQWMHFFEKLDPAKYKPDTLLKYARIIIENRGIFCLEPDIVRQFLSNCPEQIWDYIATLAEFSETSNEKEYLKALLQ